MWIKLNIKYKIFIKNLERKQGKENNQISKMEVK